MKLSALLAATSAASLLVLAGAGPAVAAAPDRFTDHVVESGTIDCSTFNPSWLFHDDFVDTLDFAGQVFTGANGDVIRVIVHVQHHSDDVNSATHFTLHEHNHYVMIFDFRANTLSYSGAVNTMQRRAIGSVIRNIGHKVYPLDSDTALKLSGPNLAGDIDFCRAVAPQGSRP